jgi:hypothetical protein
MAVCIFDGNSDMYGLGIRIGFYLQWFGAIFASWLARSEVPGLRFTNALFVAATFLALVIQTARDVSGLQVVEVYIILLLTFGGYLALVPLYIWRLFTRCNPYWDPTRYPIVDPGLVFSNLNLLLFIAVLSFEFWYWFDRLPQLTQQTCQQYGFFFAKIQLDNKEFQVVNILIYFSLLFICLILILMKCLLCIGLAEEVREERR